MGGFWNWNLIHLFNFYLAATFLISTILRISQYQAILGLVQNFPSRWPSLLQLARKHFTIFLTWSTLLPVLLTLLLLTMNMIASRLVWADADLTPTHLAQQIGPASLIMGLGASMITFDLIGIFWIGKVDRIMMEQYFDQAEYWLRSWTAPVVNIFTLGYINPRRMVHAEVRKALVEASKLINTTLWWVIAQAALRMGFGLSLWLAYALRMR